MSDPRTDQSRLRVQYKSADNLNARVRLHQLFSVNSYGFVTWLFDQVALKEDVSVLEVGCGPGWLWRTNYSRVPKSWEIVASDFSPGMISEARQKLSEHEVRARYCVCDVQALPFDNEVFDIVFANHMLYHVPNLHLALAEFSRVLKVDGILYAATNGRRHLQEIDDLMHRVQPGERWRPPTKVAFAYDDAAVDLAVHFAGIRKAEYPDELRVTEVEPLIDFIESSKDISAKFRHDLEETIQVEIEEKGFVWIGKQVGLFVAREPRKNRQ